jgi:hypothetical protein
MQTAKDRCAISGVISHPDPTLQVDPDDVVEEQAAPLVVSELPSSTSGPPSLMGLVQSSPHNPNPFMDEEMLKAIRPRRFVRILRALGMGLVPLAGILVVIGVHQHISADPRPPSEDPNLAAIGIRVNPKPTTTTSTSTKPKAEKKAKVTRAKARAKASAKRLKRPKRANKAAKKRQKVKAKPRKARASRKINKKKKKARGLSKAQKKRRIARKLHRHVKAARNAYARKQWKRAKREAQRALKIDRRNRKARIIDRFASRRLAREKRVIKHQLFHAKKDMKGKRYRRARRRAVSVLKLDPKNRRARIIKRYAERKMRRRRG